MTKIELNVTSQEIEISYLVKIIQNRTINFRTGCHYPFIIWTFHYVIIWIFRLSNVWQLLVVYWIVIHRVISNDRRIVGVWKWQVRLCFRIKFWDMKDRRSQKTQTSIGQYHQNQALRSKQVVLVLVKFERTVGSIKLFLKNFCFCCRNLQFWWGDFRKKYCQPNQRRRRN